MKVCPWSLYLWTRGGGVQSGQKGELRWDAYLSKAPNEHAHCSRAQMAFQWWPGLDIPALISHWMRTTEGRGLNLDEERSAVRSWKSPSGHTAEGCLLMAVGYLDSAWLCPSDNVSKLQFYFYKMEITRPSTHR